MRNKMSAQQSGAQHDVSRTESGAQQDVSIAVSSVQHVGAAVSSAQ